MNAVLDKLGFLELPNYGITEGKHKILIAVDDNTGLLWAPPRDDITVPLRTLNFDDARNFLRTRLVNLKQDGCVLVPYRIEGDLVSIGLTFAIGARHMGPAAADGTAFSDSPDQLADLIADIILVKESMEN